MSPPTSVPKRPWLQFRLRTLIALLTACAVLFAWISVKVRQARINRILAESGAYIIPHGDGESPLGIGVTFMSPETTDKDLECLRLLSRVYSLMLLESKVTKVTDRGMREIGSLTDLKALSIPHSAVTDDGLRELKELQDLRFLDLSYTQVTDAGLQRLRGLEKLEGISLIGTRVTDEGLNVLAQQKSLRILHIGKTKVSTVGIAKLETALPDLRIERYTLDEIPPPP